MITRFFLLLAGAVSCPAQTPAPTPPPVTSVQIVNATSVPVISLGINGRPFYPKFPQGLYTADAPVDFLTARYQATDLASGRTAETNLTWRANGHYSLVLTGNFSTNAPPGLKPPPPQCFFQVFDHDLEPGQKKLRYRVFNGLPAQSFNISAPGNETVRLDPRRFTAFDGMPPTLELKARLNNRDWPVLIRQEGAARNCTLIFYLGKNGPTLLRAFENTDESVDTRQRGEEN